MNLCVLSTKLPAPTVYQDNMSVNNLGNSGWWHGEDKTHEDQTKFGKGSSG
jgi:hypothetical protein